MPTTIPMDGSMWCSMWYTKTTDIDALNNALEGALLRASFSILGETDYRFDPHGYTKLYLLAESHLAVHTWPEKHVAWIEIASCIEDKYRKFLVEIEKSALEEVRHIKEVVSMP